VRLARAVESRPALASEARQEAVMASAVEGIVFVSYRPLATMDELHLLLLAAVSVQTNDVSLLEQVFSLPSNVLVKELAILEAYGLAQKACDKWTATARGQRLTTVWNSFQNRGEAEVRTSGRQWLLGPGEFAVDEMIRDKNESEALACGFRVADAGSAVKFLDERRGAAEGFEAFVLEWPSRAHEDTKYGIFAEAIVFDSLSLAETDEALARLEELLATHIGEVVDRFKEKEVAGVHANDAGKAEVAAASIRKNGQDVMKKFKDARRTQRRQNQHFLKVKMTCEALLAGQWLAANVSSFVDAFNTEPAAFVFRSTVPYVEPVATNKSTVSFAPSPASTAKPKQEEEGILRSLFRWLFD
jgi:hypothetical protein